MYVQVLDACAVAEVAACSEGQWEKSTDKGRTHSEEGNCEGAAAVIWTARTDWQLEE